MSRPMSSLAKTISNQRVTISNQRVQLDLLRTENAKLRAENLALPTNEELRERVRQLEKLLHDPLEGLWNLSLGKVKSRMLGILYRTPGVVPRERIHVAMHGPESDVDLKCVDVHMVKLRRQLSSHGITVETVWGVGYRLPPESRALLDALIEKQRHTAAATTIKPLNGKHHGEQHAGNT